MREAGKAAIQAKTSHDLAEKFDEEADSLKEVADKFKQVLEEHHG